MKYAFMSFSCPEVNLPEMLELARDLGYDGVEPRVSADHAHGLEYDTPHDARARAREMACKAGVSFACIATSLQYADPGVSDKHVADTDRAIDLAADIGAPAIRVFGGKIPSGLSREAAIEHVAGCLGKVADHARSRGVTVCMETHDDWCAPEHVAAVMRLVDDEAVAVNWDIMHPVRAGGSTMDGAFDTLRPWVRHVHFHDGATADGRFGMVSIGEGMIDHRRAVELLSSVPYEGFLSGEWISWQPHEQHLPREIAIMRSYEAALS